MTGSIRTVGKVGRIVPIGSPLSGVQCAGHTLSPTVVGSLPERRRHTEYRVRELQPPRSFIPARIDGEIRFDWRHEGQMGAYESVAKRGVETTKLSALGSNQRKAGGYGDMRQLFPVPEIGRRDPPPVSLSTGIQRI